MNENIFMIDDSKFSRADEARGSTRGKELFDSMRIAFRIKDEQDAICDVTEAFSRILLSGRFYDLVALMRSD